jgi:transposase
MLLETLAALRDRDHTIERLTHRLEQLLRHTFGRRSERLSPDQVLFPFATQAYPAELPETPARPPAALHGPGAAPGEAPPRGHGRKPLPAHLPRIPIVYDLPPEEKRCSTCGEALREIGREVSEQLEYQPASFHVVQHVRLKYACKRCEGNVLLAERPALPLEKGVPAAGVLAHVVTSKYADHLPLHRLEGIFRRHGLAISRSTLCGWVASVAELLEPIYLAMKRDVLASKVVHTDDTPVRVLDLTREQTREGRVWVYVGDREHPQTVYDYSPNHERTWPVAFLGERAGSILPPFRR